MDLSVFNLLMSTNPNTSAAENLFSDAAQGSIPAVSEKSQDSLRTGEAFLQVLDQLRSGKTEKDADILYNTISARADAASSLKNLKRGHASRENVKVVKLHIKRTRASEKLRKLDEEKAAAAAPIQNGQKIPTRENIAAAQETAPVQQEQTDTQNAAPSIDFKTFSSSASPVEERETTFVPTEELTAADILINSAIQATLAPLPQTPQTTIKEQMPEEHSLSAVFLPQEEEAPAVSPQIAQPEQKAEIRPEAPAEEQENFDFAPTETFVQKQDKQPEERAANTEIKQPEKMQADLPAKHAVHETAEKAPIRTKAAPEKTAAFRPVSADTTTGQEIQSFDGDYSSHQAHRQAEQLAHDLPAQTNIAITVETQAPVVQEAALPHVVSKRSSVAEKTKETDTETAEPITEEKEAPKVPVPAKELTLQSGKTDHSRSSAQEETKPADQPNGLAALPVQGKSLPTDSVAPQGEGQIAEIGTPSVSQTPVAALSVGHELKGKAVSGNVPVQRSVPVNELVDQIKINIKKALKDGLDKIDIVLKPKELGTIKIHLEIGKDGTMKAVLSTARAETLDLLRSDLTALKQALADSGFDLNDQAFSFNYRGERFNEDQHHTHKHTDSFVNSEEEVSETDSVLSANTLSISGRYALNIRV
ncbi:MAG: flagellar hook-length control protein FliK [Alphaproteobacteria bacterium]|nr:flagellar hook-length control protein FliK [Alphaproteobacteria bacterium]